MVNDRKNHRRVSRMKKEEPREKYDINNIDKYL